MEARFKKAAIVDDDHIYVYGAKRAMQKIDFAKEVLVYSNGKEALDGLSYIIEKNDELPDVLFLDLNMPVLDGWQFLDEFSLLNPNKEMIIYIVTSSINPDDQERAKQYSLNGKYVVKPITMKKLVALFGIDKDSM